LVFVSQVPCTFEFFAEESFVAEQSKDALLVAVLWSFFHASPKHHVSDFICAGNAEASLADV
jgi:hypothetical protein